MSNGQSDGIDTIVQANSDDGENYLDLTATFRVMDNADLLVGINNILDEEPPLVGGSLSSNANATAGFYDTLGPQQLLLLPPNYVELSATPGPSDAHGLCWSVFREPAADLSFNVCGALLEMDPTLEQRGYNDMKAALELASAD